MRDLALGLAKFLGFDVAPKKIAGPTSQMTVLGASLTLQTRILALDPDKAISYEEQVSEALKRKPSMRMTDFFEPDLQAGARGPVQAGGSALSHVHVHGNAASDEVRCKACAAWARCHA